MKKILYLIITISVIAGCNAKNESPDAWGNFEAKEIMISSESNGKILLFPLEKGSQIKKDQEIAIIDTSLFSLRILEFEALRKSILSKLSTIDAQNGIIDQQIANLKVNIDRVTKMLLDKAATQKQFDDLNGQLKVLKKQQSANNTQKVSVRSELGVLDAKKAFLLEQINRCKIKSPSDGTVIEKYAETGEITAAGKPLLKIADLRRMELKVYISGAQLGSVKLNQECTIRIDKGENDYQSFNGIISHISDKAEFTPKIIQTKEERVHMVYAVIIIVDNDGSLKSGMPAEAFFNPSN